MEINEFVEELSSLVDGALANDLPVDDILYLLQAEYVAVRDAAGYLGEDR